MAALPAGSKNTGNRVYLAPDNSLWVDLRPAYPTYERILLFKELTSTSSAVAPFNFRVVTNTYAIPVLNLVNWLTFTVACTATLPAVLAGTNFTWYIKNASTGTLVINAATTANDIYFRAAFNTISINPGDAVIIHGDGASFQVQ